MQARGVDSTVQSEQIFDGGNMLGVASCHHTPHPDRLAISPAAATAALLSSLLAELRVTEERFVNDLHCLSVDYLQPLRDRTLRNSRCRQPHLIYSLADHRASKLLWQVASSAGRTHQCSSAMPSR